MMDFEEWDAICNEIENDIEKVNRKMAFRGLQITGPTSVSVAEKSRKNIDEDYEKLHRDPTMCRLKHLKQLLVTQLDYIQRTGEMPPTLTELDENLSRQ